MMYVMGTLRIYKRRSIKFAIEVLLVLFSYRYCVKVCFSYHKLRCFSVYVHDDKWLIAQNRLLNMTKLIN